MTLSLQCNLEYLILTLREESGFNHEIYWARFKEQIIFHKKFFN